MSSLELQRSLMEELQTIESQISIRFQRNPELYPKYDKENIKSVDYKIFKGKKSRGYKHNLLQATEIRRMVDQYAKLSNDLQEQKLPISFTLSEFDTIFKDLEETSSELKSFRSFYSMNSSNILSEFAVDINLSTQFSGEESLGQYLDLLEFHEIWLNLNSEKLSYVKYLEIIFQFENYHLIRFRNEKNKEYLKYLEKLWMYLLGFVKRALPLVDIENWIKESKKEKKDDSLYCKICDKTFAKETVFQGHLKGKKHLKNLDNYQIKKDYKYYENLIIKIFTQILSTQYLKTKLNTERKKALTEREKAIELAQLEKDEPFSDIDSDNETSLYESLTRIDSEEYYDNNPQNLPLGPDGQPIPYWLYRLQGLGIQHTCEICGNFTYKGRKTFETHFFNTRHQHGLKCLGIEWDKTFKDIVKIEEAIKLWNKINNGKKFVDLEKENSKQVEDEEGNVMSEKIYNDLKNQGLI